MKLKTLMFWLALLTGMVVYAAGNYIDFVQNENRLTITRMENGQ
jgi:hypothetical protein